MLLCLRACSIPTSRMVVMMVVVQVTQGRPGPTIMIQVKGLIMRLGVAGLPFPLTVRLTGRRQLAVLASPGLVLVVGVVLLVLFPQPLRLLDEWLLVALVQQPEGEKNKNCFSPVGVLSENESRFVACVRERIIKDAVIVSYVTCFVLVRMRKRLHHSPPEFAQGLAELGVVQVGVLVGQLPPRGLRPHHEGVHGPLHVRLALVPVVHAHRHGHQSPVVPVQHLTHRLPDADGEAVVLLLGFGPPSASVVPARIRHAERGELLWRAAQGRVRPGWSSGSAR